MNTPTNDPNDTPTGFTSPPIRLTPADRIVRRSECWRPACRSEFPGYATIIFTITGHVVALCHRARYDDLGHRADRWRHEIAA